MGTKNTCRQTLRETWTNTSEFNYSKFSILHAHMKGTYLPINYNDWKNITLRNDIDDTVNSNYSAVSEIDWNKSRQNDFPWHGKYILFRYHILKQRTSQNVNENEHIDDVASHAHFQIQVVFLIGKTENNETQEKIIGESQTYNDLIQEDFIDSYNNLTLKSVMMLKWVVKNCDRKGTLQEVLLCFALLYFISILFCFKLKIHSALCDEMWRWHFCECTEFDSFLTWWHNPSIFGNCPSLQPTNGAYTFAHQSIEIPQRYFGWFALLPC